MHNNSDLDLVNIKNKSHWIVSHTFHWLSSISSYKTKPSYSVTLNTRLLIPSCETTRLLNTYNNTIINYHSCPALSLLVNIHSLPLPQMWRSTAMRQTFLCGHNLTKRNIPVWKKHKIKFTEKRIENWKNECRLLKTQATKAKPKMK